ncbi:MAG: RdgB/HAM1 family non-canonical purine NTP pyrophosphatase [Bacteroidales bacterium]|nr:RdgB/HAM1 family non-canonical purine NTP pyrophosphatase [Bacteroidales bacterium]
MKLIFATNNRYKFEEIKHALGGFFQLINLTDLGFVGEIPETHDTIEENAAEKALFIYNKYGIDCFADDTGLEIDVLSGEPGVYSARYAGDNCSFDDNMDKVLEKMIFTDDRKARFRTVIALIEGGNLKTFEGRVEGEILKTKVGSGGFGYDPIFRPVGYNLTFAQMSLDEKNKISHRAIAVNELVEYLKNSYAIKK